MPQDRSGESDAAAFLGMGFVAAGGVLVTCWHCVAGALDEGARGEGGRSDDAGDVQLAAGARSPTTRPEMRRIRKKPKRGFW
jgi:hypothetical protein